MYHHIKQLMYSVHIGIPDPRFGNMLLEQFGGANGELAAAMQYSVQGLNCDDPERKDLLMDIGTEELSHLEVVGTEVWPFIIQWATLGRRIISRLLANLMSIFEAISRLKRARRSCTNA